MKQHHTRAGIVFEKVAPPRGERGLKQKIMDAIAAAVWSLPLAGSVD